MIPLPRGRGESDGSLNLDPPMKTLLRGIAALTLLAAPAAAQEAPADSLAKGAVSATFSINGSESTLGLWKMVGDAHNLGLQLGIGIQSGENDAANIEADNRFVSLGLMSRHYVGRRGPVAPFLEAGGYVAVQKIESESVLGGESEEDGLGLGVQAAFGAEWFPHPRVSFGALSGIRFDRNRLEMDDDETVTSSFVSSFTGSLAMRVVL